jgi:hypothetical protein
MNLEECDWKLSQPIITTIIITIIIITATA